MEQETEFKTAPELYTIREVLERLKISRQTLWNLTRKGNIKTVRVGGSIRYTAENISQLITTNAGQ